MNIKVLGRKQSEDNDKFNLVFNNIEQYVSKEHLDNLLDRTVNEVKLQTKNKKVGYGWSGGKDSVVLKLVMDNCGIEPCVLGMTHNLEYPEFLKFVTENMPDELMVFNSQHNLEWLSENLSWLFPKDSKTASKWFKAIQHKAQIQLYRKYNLDMICLGRRKLDSNYVGKGTNLYYNSQQRVWRYSPISDWTHEEVLAAMKYYNLPFAPFYSWPNGWVVGSGNWAARQWTGTEEEAWSQVYSIDPNVVSFAATKIQSAKIFLQGL